jgi:hypothetical protein
MSVHKQQDSGGDRESVPDEYPADDWTPKQQENWEQYGEPVYRNLETEIGRTWYRRCWRPKQRNEGMMTRSFVKLGEPEDYVVTEVEGHLQPMGNITAEMMRQLTAYSVDKDELDEAVADIVQAKVQTMSTKRQQRLLAEAQELANTYGLNGVTQDG